MGRIIAIDYGLKRIGIATTDPLQIIATGLETVATKDIFKYLKEYCSQEEVECIVIGQPLQTNGAASEITPQIEVFIEKLKKLLPGIKTDRMDERFTSIMARHSMHEAGLKRKDKHNKELVDKTSAVILLQSYMQKHSL